MTAAAFDEILRRLVAAGAEFVVIGGLALGARGVVRATKDIDIVVASNVENLRVVAEVAVEAGGARTARRGATRNSLLDRGGARQRGTDGNRHGARTCSESTWQSAR